MAGKIIWNNILQAAQLQTKRLEQATKQRRTPIKVKYYPLLTALNKIDDRIDLALMLSEFKQTPKN